MAGNFRMCGVAIAWSMGFVHNPCPSGVHVTQTNVWYGHCLAEGVVEHPLPSGVHTARTKIVGQAPTTLPYRHLAKQKKTIGYEGAIFSICEPKLFKCELLCGGGDEKDHKEDSGQDSMSAKEAEEWWGVKRREAEH